MSLEAPVDFDAKLHTRQAQAFLTPATEVLYGGAAGGGKSFLIRVAAIWWCMMIPGLQVYIFRRIFRELISNHMHGPTGFPRLLHGLVRAGFVRIVKTEIRFWNGARIYLNACQYEHDVNTYQGSEFHVLLIDELTHWTQGMYKFLRTRVRMTGIELPPQFAGQFPKILCGTNPGSIGHHWVKKMFVDGGSATIRKMPPSEGGMLRQFIPAKLSDNPTLLSADPFYVDKLAGAGDPLLVRALKDGDWKIVAGAMFGYAWRDELHTCRPFAIPERWEIWRGADDGFNSPASVHWLTQDPDAKTLYVIHELHKTGMLPDEFARRVKEGDQSVTLIDGYGNRNQNRTPLDGLMDSAAFADAGHGTGNQRVPSRAAAMNALGCRWKPVDKGPGSRIHRVQEMHRLLGPNLKDRRKRPGIIFFDTCTNAIATIPTLPRDKKKPEDVDTNADDHNFDSVSYGVQRKTGGISRMQVSGI